MKLTRIQVARLQSLEDEAGRLRPSAVVDDARSEDSPLHELFDWNVERAAERHWKDRAREIIRSVTIRYTRNSYVLKAPVYIRDPAVASGEEGYATVVSVRSEPEQAREAVLSALDQVAAHVRRSAAIADTIGLADEFHALLEFVTGLAARAKDAAA